MKRLKALCIKGLSGHGMRVTMRERIEVKCIPPQDPQKLLTQNSPHENLAIAWTKILQKEEGLEDETNQIEKLPREEPEQKERVEEKRLLTVLGDMRFYCIQRISPHSNGTAACG